MADALIVIGLVLFAVFVALGSSSNSEQHEKCKNLGMVVTQYEGKSYCSRIQDLH